MGVHDQAGCKHARDEFVLAKQCTFLQGESEPPLLADTLTLFTPQLSSIVQSGAIGPRADGWQFTWKRL